MRRCRPPKRRNGTDSIGRLLASPHGVGFLDQRLPNTPITELAARGNFRRYPQNTRTRPMTADLVCTPPTLRTDQPSREYLTRRQSADYIREELGRPMSFSTASKLAALGEFAAPTVWWGRRPLYLRDDLRAWAESRSRRDPPHRGRTSPALAPASGPREASS